MPISRTTAARTVALLALLAACGDQGPGATVYQLRQLNNASVPYVDTLGCCIYQGASLRLDNGDYDARLWFQNRLNGLSDTVVELGNYRVSADSLCFTPTTASLPLSLYGATRSGDTIRLKLGGNGPGAIDQFSALLVR
ncbi:MAG: hypothetical protein SGJ01_10855 [Gemmatimonadota bacterium]|nr:hypothetical protein [Gemmatimonadota bacterium]